MSENFERAAVQLYRKMGQEPFCACSRYDVCVRACVCVCVMRQGIQIT